jgi:hypothetical protein
MANGADPKPTTRRADTSAPTTAPKPRVRSSKAAEQNFIVATMFDKFMRFISGY